MDTKTSDNISTIVSRDDLVAGLRKGSASIKFIKKDGSLRIMNCTLDVEYDRKSEGGVSRPDNILPVWDIDADAWRSVNLDTIEEVLFL